MSKHYNLTVTDDNGKSVTTSNTSTEHAEEILRMMQLAGMEDSSCGCGESIEENEYQPTPANDKLDLDDYSKKSGESIPKQKKSLDKAPSRGDNPLEYSLDENEIYESLMSEIEKVEEAKVGTPGSLDKVEAQIKKLKDMAQKAKDAGDPQKANQIQSSDEMTELLRKQRKLKNESVEESKVEEKKAKPDFADIDGDGDKKETMKKAAKDKKEKANESVEEGMEADEVKAMFMSYPEDAEKVKATGELDTDSQLYMDLFGYYQDEMPYGTQKARDGDPTEWLEMRLSDLGMMESTNEGSEYCDCGCDCGKPICDSCGKPHKDMKQESPELARLRKLAGNEKIDEILPAVGAVAGAIGRALVSKGVKGMASRAAATTVANKALTKKNNTPQ